MRRGEMSHAGILVMVAVLAALYSATRYVGNTASGDTSPEMAPPWQLVAQPGEGTPVAAPVQYPVGGETYVPQRSAHPGPYAQPETRSPTSDMQRDAETLNLANQPQDSASGEDVTGPSDTVSDPKPTSPSSGPAVAQDNPARINTEATRDKTRLACASCPAKPQAPAARRAKTQASRPVSPCCPTPARYCPELARRWPTSPLGQQWKDITGQPHQAPETGPSAGSPTVTRVIKGRAGSLSAGRWIGQQGRKKLRLACDHD